MAAAAGCGALLGLLIATPSPAVGAGESGLPQPPPIVNRTPVTVAPPAPTRRVRATAATSDAASPASTIAPPPSTPRPAEPLTGTGEGRPLLASAAIEPPDALAATLELAAAEAPGRLRARAPGDYSDGQAAVSGSVLDVEGRPVAGVRVAVEPLRALIRPGDPPPLPDPRIFSGEAVTGKNGRYRIAGFGVGRYLVRMVSEPTGRYAAYSEAVWTEAGNTAVAPDLRLARYAYVEGEVLDAATGKPVPDLAVTGQRAGIYARPSVTDHARTGTDGHFRLRLVQGNNLVFVTPPPSAGVRGATLRPAGGFKRGINRFPPPDSRQQLLLQPDETRVVRFLIDPSQLGEWKTLEELRREAEERKK